ncbi:MAG: DUF5681 domain-containing protein [Acetobacteraceae bacterium]
MTDEVREPEGSGKKQGGATKWKPGQSGNPAGRPPGRNKILAALDGAGDDAAKEILDKAVELAKGGDLRAIELIMSRTWPARKGRALQFALPKVEKLGDLPAANASVIQAVSEGLISPEEGQTMTGLLKEHANILEATDLAADVAAMREELAALKAGQS